MKRIILFLVASLLLTSCGQVASTAQTTPDAQAPNAQATPEVGNPEIISEHQAKLMEGVDAWNAWRLQNPKVKPDLRKATLTRINLENFDLHRAILNNSNLVNAKLMGADLSNANLRGANLLKADLSGTILTGAKYDSRTKWPVGFDPVAAGATLVTK